MSKILGIDLGTNSIGLAIRDENEFDWFGVYTFKKGVGEGKSGEFSFAAERTKHRSSRRLYNARRYRKWETLKFLIKNGYCPLKIDELNKWKHYEKGNGRIFPLNNTEFNNWIKLDFNNDGIQDCTSPYQLRRELITNKLDLSINDNKFKIGRAFYHIAQRRGFKSSRKGGDKEKSSMYKGGGETNTIGVDDYKDLIINKGSLGAAFAHLEDEGIRVRNRYTLRKDYSNEIEKIIKFQKLNEQFGENITKAIFYQRPLRSQKGLIGTCTLEKEKHRCPISHPKFEAFRAWSFINTIKYKNEDSEKFVSIPFELKKQIYDEVFFRKSKSNFKFIDIRKCIEKNGSKAWILNYKKKLDDSNVSGCPISARLKSVFGDNWENIIIKTNETRINKKGKTINIQYDIEDIWHILFSFEDEEVFDEFITDKLKLNEEQVKDLNILWKSFPIGYANLSLKAIKNILPFLEEGLIYIEAVLLAKIPQLIGYELFNKNKEFILNEIKSEIKLNRDAKDIIIITNNLISKYKSLEIKFAYKDISYKLDDSDLKDIEENSIAHFGVKRWEAKTDEQIKAILKSVTEKYQNFFSTSSRGYIKPPHLLEQIKDFLMGNFSLTDKELSKMYHPSQIAIYSKEDDQLYLKSPKTAAFKNPMAYKTLYRLKDVINYLIEIGKIDNETKVVVEIARELNDANKRNAIETYQRRREVENKEFAIAITELQKDPEFKGIADPNNKTDKDKFRLWTEQLDNKDEILKTITATKDDIKKYRLWKEQNCQCMYTGKVISITDLFNPNTIDFEHTIPRSKSFDNSLANLTVCYADYNRSVKNNRIPTELPNYNSESNGFSAIKPRLENWKKRIDELEKQIDIWKFKSKIAIDKDGKDRAIREKHLRYFEYDYWKNKVDRFTREDVPQGFKNSQLRDTQIISKYAFHYLKTVFNKVEVQKGEVTAQFRKIYEVQEKDKKKSRTKHHHHAIDAAVLTLIPDSAKREEILKTAYKWEEKYKKQYTTKPFSGFKQNIITDIEETILINNIPNKDQALTIGKKNVRSRGKIVWLRDKSGKLIFDEQNNKIPKVAMGDCIRGELHQQTYYGKIKVVKRDDDNKPLRNDDNNWEYETKNDGFKFVLRTPIEKITDLKKIVDPDIAKMIEKQQNGRSLAQTIAEGVWMLDKSGKKVNKIRRVRCWARSTSLLKIKEQTYKSEHDYKNYYYADTGDNYAFALYVAKDGSKKIVSRNLFEISQFEDKTAIKDIKDLFENTIMLTKTKEANLYHVFQSGQKVIFYENNREELKDLDNLSERLYFVKVLFSSNDGRIKFQHHLDARNDDQLSIDFPKEAFGVKGKNGFSKFSTDFIQPRLLLSPNNLNCIIENKDFTITLDGEIKFLF